MKRLTDTEYLLRDYDEALAGIPLFKGAAKEDIPAMLLCLKADFREYEKNEFILKEGDEAKRIGVVLRGFVQVVQEDYYGNRAILNTAGEGQIFAEGFACSDTDYLPVSVITNGPAVILFLDTDSIFHNPNFCVFHQIIVENLLKIVCSKNVFMNARLKNTMHKSTRDKLLAFLMDEKRKHQSNTFDIEFTRQELADYLGVERSAMSTELSKMVKEKILITNRSHFELLQ